MPTMGKNISKLGQGNSYFWVGVCIPKHGLCLVGLGLIGLLMPAAIILKTEKWYISLNKFSKKNPSSSPDYRFKVHLT